MDFTLRNVAKSFRCHQSSLAELVCRPNHSQSSTFLDSGCCIPCLQPTRPEYRQVSRGRLDPACRRDRFQPDKTGFSCTISRLGLCTTQGLAQPPHLWALPGTSRGCHRVPASTGRCRRGPAKPRHSRKAQNRYEGRLGILHGPNRLCGLRMTSRCAAKSPRTAGCPTR